MISRVLTLAMVTLAFASVITYYIRSSAQTEVAGEEIDPPVVELIETVDVLRDAGGGEIIIEVMADGTIQTSCGTPHNGDLTNPR